MRKVFGTEMGTIKDLMEGARGVGTNYGVGLDEQLAVLGQLNRTLGTEASSAYEGFMTGAVEGAKKLGLSFTDATGKMLSMPEMLIKLQGKYGKSLEGNLKAQAELDAAFGDSSAVVKHLYGNVALLQRNITELGGSDGLKRTQEMASKLVKPWDRFVQILKAIQTVIGLTLIPVSMFDNVWQSVKGGFLKSWNWIVEKLNKIPGVDISMANETSSPPLTVNNLSTGGELKGIDKGGISKSVSNNSRSVTDNSRKINTVNIYPKEMITPG
ncbi:phage tail tape measure protein, partial [Salmonella enterica]|nr:phage tail tape measure protein [Salmonella enterica]